VARSREFSLILHSKERLSGALRAAVREAWGIDLKGAGESPDAAPPPVGARAGPRQTDRLID
jgi:hypothetical protein